MNHMGKIAAGIALVVGSAFASSAVGAPIEVAKVEGAKRSNGDVKFFLADPELGVAGVYTVRGVELYFEARRSVDGENGAPGALSLRVVDSEARTLALGGESYATHWTPQQNEFGAKEGFAYAQLLSGLGKALGAADLHVSLSAEKSALADLATRAAGTPAGQFPARATMTSRTSFAPEVMQTADFYQRMAADVQMTRQRDGMLEAKLGNGIVFMSSQTFIPDEPDQETGEMGRIDAYSMVRGSDGYVLATQLGGDELPEGWANAMEIETERDHHALATDLGAAAMKLNALAYSAGATQGVALSDATERDAMHRLAQSLTTHLLPVRDEAPSLTLSSGPDNQATAVYGRYRTDIQVWRKAFVGIAEHSGTRVSKWRYANTTSTAARTYMGGIDFCNHGTCPGAGTMTRKCTFTGPRLWDYRLPKVRTDAFRHTCATGYNLVSIGGHNCHDDSSVQVRAVRGQAYSQTGGRCNDPTPHGYAPTCGLQ
jgi:hypothetical protein